MCFGDKIFTKTMARNIQLEEAARHGKLDFLELLLKENPSILADYKLLSLGESLLHVATKSGNRAFVHELMKTDPNLAGELNKDGFRPLDVAVITGNFGIFKDILSYNRDLCLLKGKDGRTTLHYAAMKERVDVIDELLSLCPNCIEDVTVHGETALHLAVKNHQFEAFVALMKWLQTLDKKSMINYGDEDGDTTLHLAVLTRQHACINILLAENRGTLEVNTKNGKGLTALDLLDIQDSYDTKIKHKLENAGAITSPQCSSSTKRNHNLIIQSEASNNWFDYFKFQRQRDSPSDARNPLLVVAVLIATVCFQAGVSPPDGILDKPNKNVGPPTPSPPPYSANPVAVSAISAASAVFGSHATAFLFLFTNSLGLSASTCIIIYLTSGFPFKRELHIALYSMMFSYGFAINAILRGSDKSMAYVITTVAFTLPFVVRWVPIWGTKAWSHWRKGHNARNATLPIGN